MQTRSRTTLAVASSPLPRLLLPFLLLLATATAALHAPGCLPDEPATITSQSVFQVPDPTTSGEPFTELTLTGFTCASRQPGARARFGVTRVVRDDAGAPIDLCGVVENGEIFHAGSTFNCDQSEVGFPPVRDCDNIQTAVVESTIRPMRFTIPARAGLIVSLRNNTCAFVFLNDDGEDTYSTCLVAIPDTAFAIQEECPHPARDGFIGSVHSPVREGGPNWELR
ncbi:hypothetical protein C8R43DRAFT_1150635 [Mycena crocata]|nr:hypothetical protein C8R43DRAFT_1150635 [Mycena crocata]